MKKYFFLALVSLALVGAGCGADDETVNTNTAASNTNVVANTTRNTNTVEDDNVNSLLNEVAGNANMAKNDTTNASTNDMVNDDQDEAEGATTLIIEDMAFMPTDLTVAAGDTVTVINNDSLPHTVTAGDGSFDTSTIAAGASGTFTAPTEPGTYEYICSVHPSMTGTLTVE
jgi:plastocyanin